MRLAALYTDEMLANTLEVAQRCRFDPEVIRENYKYPLESVGNGETPAQTLVRKTWEGARGKYPAGIPEKVSLQLERELQLIVELKYEMFFLTVEDIVRFARSKDILCQGRGSSANSAVCFCLGITAINPDKGHLLFERFLSRHRREPPDIDVDFEHQRREEVIQYIYKKYGRERAAIAAVVICYRSRSALRDVGKALGIDARLVDEFAKDHYWFDDFVLGGAVRSCCWPAVSSNQQVLGEFVDARLVDEFGDLVTGSTTPCSAINCAPPPSAWACRRTNSSCGNGSSSRRNSRVFRAT